MAEKNISITAKTRLLVQPISALNSLKHAPVTFLLERVHTHLPQAIAPLEFPPMAWP
jgi:hypothetical protein